MRRGGGGGGGATLSPVAGGRPFKGETEDEGERVEFPPEIVPLNRVRVRQLPFVVVVSSCNFLASLETTAAQKKPGGMF